MQHASRIADEAQEGADAQWHRPNGRSCAHRFADDGAIPNNPALPLLVYPGALNLLGGDPAAKCEAVFAANDWGGCWRNGIYPFPHYHSTAHEVLGICRGEVRVRLGGDVGIELTVRGRCGGDPRRGRASEPGREARSPGGRGVPARATLRPLPRPAGGAAAGAREHCSASRYPRRIPSTAPMGRWSSTGCARLTTANCR